MKCYAYFQGTKTALDEQLALLNRWGELWESSGWEPMIITELDAAKHPRFAEWKAAFEKIPTINPKEYEMACWLRWIAMAALPGNDPSLMTDYDVIPNGFARDETARAYGLLPLLLCDCVPCAVFGLPSQFSNAIEIFLGTAPVIENGKPHLSDMHAVRDVAFPREDLCREYFTSGWKTAPLIHFPHSRCNPQARSQVIEAALKQLKAEQAGPVGPLHDAPEVETMASKRRKLIAELKLLSDTPSRKILTYQELRKQGIIGNARKRKKQRLVI